MSSPEAPEVLHIYRGQIAELELAGPHEDNVRYVRGDIAEGREAELLDLVEHWLEFQAAAGEMDSPWKESYTALRAAGREVK